MKSSFTKLGIVVLFCTLLFSTAAVWAQDPTGRILGTITDPKGAVVPGAKITVTNTGTQIHNETTTDRDGYFQVLDLPIGTYRVVIEKAGFRKIAIEDQMLTINRALRLDTQMELGSTNEVVEVSSQMTTVETVSATLGQTMVGSSITALPLNGRNTYDLALLLPGVVEVNPDSGAAGNFGVAGGRSDSVTYLLDGGMNNNLLSNGVVFNPSPDTIAEFRILTSNYTAEYGRNAGGIVSAVTKSGTNQYHGGAFDFLRNDAFNANTFFNNLNGQPREVLKRNQFGANIGGPISIPKVVHGQDRMFFFVSYEGQRQVQTVTTDKIQVFTPKELNGDFSLSNGGAPDNGVVCYLTGNNLDGTPCQQFDPSGSGNLVPGVAHSFFQPDSAKAKLGIIDPAQINSVAAKYISSGLVPSDPSGFLIGQGGSKNNSDGLTGRFDLELTSKDRLSATLGSSRNPSNSPFRSTSTDPVGYGSTSAVHTYFANIGYTRTFSSTTLNEFRFTTQRHNQVQAVPAKTLPTPADLGVGVTPDQSTGPTRIFYATGLGLGFSSQGPTKLIDNTFTTADTFSWTHGRHNWKFGGSYSPYQNNTLFDFFVDGEFDFDGGAGIGSSNSFADFLMGLPDFYLQFGSAPSNIRSHALYGFAQDEWHVSKSLTLTLGTRYEYSSPKLDTKGRSFSLHLGQQSVVFPGAPTGLLFPGDQGAPKGANFPDRNDWAPRVGFAWSPGSGGKTSIRGGIGVFYDILKGEDNLQFNGQAPFFGFAFLGWNPINNPTQEVNYLSQPFLSNNTGTPNSFPSKPPSPNLDFGAAGFLPFGGGGVFFVNPHLRTPYVYQYNLSVQREVAKNLLLEVSYVGNSSHKLTSLVDANPFQLGTFTRIFNNVPGGDFSFLPEFRNISNGNYNSLEASLQKQFSGAGPLGQMGFILSYTYGHEIDNASGFRQRGSEVPFYNPRQFRTSGDFDLRHRISLSGVWDLPFGHAWASGPKRLTNGWSLAPIFVYRTGFPLDVFAPFTQSGSSPGPSGAGDRDNVRANFAAGTTVGNFTTFDPKNQQTINGTPGNYFFNPNNFNTDGSSNFGFPTSSQVVADLSLATYGSVPRNFLRGPGRTNLNLALIKETALAGERLKLTFRAEFFNIFNHTEFDNPDTGLQSGTFGQILSTADPRIIQLALKLNF
jgi:hypothetical protein